MSNTLIVDLRHYLNEDGSMGNLTKPNERLVTYLGSIVEVVTNHENNEFVSTTIRCRRHPEHKRCTGRIVAGVDSGHSYEIDWHCPLCGDNGIISGWRGTIWDISMGRSGKLNRENQVARGKEISLDELEDKLFEIDEDALTIPKLHGFLSAIIVGPELVKPMDWLPHVFNIEGEMPDFSSLNQANLVFGNVVDFHNQIIRDMDTGQYQPIFGINRRGKKEIPDPIPWCFSFAEGVSLTQKVWFAEDDEALAALLLPIYYFIDPEGFGEMSKSLSGRERRGFDQKMISMIPDTVLAIRNYWREKSQRSTHYKTKAVIIPFGKGKKQTPGRNNPCPCGSGKKYKYCCGKEE